MNGSIPDTRVTVCTEEIGCTACNSYCEGFSLSLNKYMKKSKEIILKWVDEFDLRDAKGETY
jgi:hypothetical protein